MSKEIVVFAFVKDSFSREQGMIVYAFKEVFESALVSQSGRDYDPKLLSAELRRIYGLKVPVKALDGLVQDLVKMELLTINNNVRPAHVTVNSLHKVKPDDEVLNETLEELDRFSRKHEFYSDDVDERFFEWIKRLAFISEESVHEDDVIFSYFAKHLRDTSEQKFNRLQDVYAGCLLAEAVLTLGANASGDMLKSTRFYFDAPLLLDYLDVNSKESSEYIFDVIDMVRSSGGEICTFDHCIEEAERVFRGVLKAFDNQEVVANEIGQRLRGNPNHILRVRNYAGSLRKILVENNIAIYDAKGFESTDAFFYPFPPDLETELASSLGNHQSIDPRLVDAKSIATVARLRRFSKPQKLVEAKHVFVTRNSNVANVALEFQQRAYDDRKESIPYCFMDSSLAAYLWVNFGNGSIELASKKLIAACTSNLAPSSSIVRNVRDLVGEEEYINDFSRLIEDRENAAYATFLNSVKRPLTKETMRLTIDDIKEFMVGVISEDIEESYTPLKKKEEARRERLRAKLERRGEICEKLRAAEAIGSRVGCVTHRILLIILMLPGAISLFKADWISQSTVFTFFAVLFYYIVPFLRLNSFEKFFLVIMRNRAARRNNFYHVLRFWHKARGQQGSARSASTEM